MGNVCCHSQSKEQTNATNLLEWKVVIPKEQCLVLSPHFSRCLWKVSYKLINMTKLALVKTKIKRWNVISIKLNFYVNKSKLPKYIMMKMIDLQQSAPQSKGPPELHSYVKASLHSNWWVPLQNQLLNTLEEYQED